MNRKRLLAAFKLIAAICLLTVLCQGRAHASSVMSLESQPEPESLEDGGLSASVTDGAASVTDGAVSVTDGAVSVTAWLKRYRECYCAKDIDGLTSMSLPKSLSHSREQLERDFSAVVAIALTHEDITVETGEGQVFACDAAVTVRETIEYLQPDGDIRRIISYPSYFLRKTADGYRLLERGAVHKPVDSGGSTYFVNIDKMETHMQNGFMFLNAGGNDEMLLRNAEAEFRRALDLDPQQHRAHSALGIIHYRTKNYKQAEEHFSTALTLAESAENGAFLLGKRYHLAMIHKYLGFCYYETFRPGEATTELMKSLRFNSTPMAAQYCLGLILMDRGSINKAAALFEKILIGNPDDKFADACLRSIRHARNGVRHLSRKEPVAAELELRSAISIYQRFYSARKKYVLAMIMLAESMHDSGRSREALDTMEKALKCAPDKGSRNKVITGIDDIKSAMGETDQ